MRDVTLGQIGNTILSLWRLTYPIWKVVLAFVSITFMMLLVVFPQHVEKDMRGIPTAGMSQIPPMFDWAYHLWLGCFMFLFLYWVVRTFSDWDKKRFPKPE